MTRDPPERASVTSRAEARDLGVPLQAGRGISPQQTNDQRERRHHRRRRGLAAPASVGTSSASRSPGARCSSGPSGRCGPLSRMPPWPWWCARTGWRRRGRSGSRGASGWRRGASDARTRCAAASPRSTRADGTVVLIHDAARPFVPRRGRAPGRVGGRRDGAAVLAAPVVDTVKRLRSDGSVETTVPREQLVRALTPAGVPCRRASARLGGRRRARCGPTRRLWWSAWEGR